MNCGTRIAWSLTCPRGGAGIRCRAALPRKTNVVLYVAGFGRFEGTTTQFTKDGTGICFEYTARKRKRIAEQLKLFVKEGLTAVTFLRDGERIRDVTIQNFTRPAVKSSIAKLLMFL